MSVRPSMTLEGVIQNMSSELGVDFRLNTYPPETTGLKTETFDVDWRLGEEDDWKPCFHQHRGGTSVARAIALHMFRSWCEGWLACRALLNSAPSS